MDEMTLFPIEPEPSRMESNRSGVRPAHLNKFPFGSEPPEGSTEIYVGGPEDRRPPLAVPEWPDLLDAAVWDPASALARVLADLAMDNYSAAEAEIIALLRTKAAESMTNHERFTWLMRLRDGDTAWLEGPRGLVSTAFDFCCGHAPSERAAATFAAGSRLWRAAAI